MSTSTGPAEQWHVRAVVLPDGDEPEDWWLAGGLLRDRPIPDVDPPTLPGRFVVCGLVDAHAHLTLPTLGLPGTPGDDYVSTALDAQLRAGVLAVRDAGVVAKASRAPRPPGGPIVLGGSHYLAPTGGYFPNLLGDEGVEEAALVERALAEVRGGADWVKVVADSPMGPTMFFDAPSNYRPAAVAAMVDAVHGAGGRVAAHVSGSNVRALIDAGVDSIEHGNAIEPEDVVLMAERGTAWTPTLGTVLGFCDMVLAQEGHPWRALAISTRENLAVTVPEAARRGVTILAGTDQLDHGDVAGELAWLVRLGLTPLEALRAATTSARDFLRLAGLVDGAPADIVTYDADPRDHPDVLRHPTAVVLRGRRCR